MSEDSVVRFERPDAVEDPMTALLREGATRMIQQAVEAELAELLAPQRLKRVFRIDIETCRHCGGRVKVIASIEDPGVIKQILDHLDRRAGQQPLARAPPQRELPGFKD